ncbi:TPA: hypothetical protein HA351_04655 [Methanosarcinaceae archaeon]|nr:hypothetical protein [Methanosarcinaceae archaeon]
MLEELGRAEEGEKYAKSWESKQSPGFISVTETPGFEETGLPEKKEKPEGGEEVFSGSTAQKRQGWNETSENSSSEKRERKIEEKPLRNQAPGKPYGLINLENEPAEMPVKTKELKEETETEMSGSKKLPEEGKNMKRDTGTNYGSMAEPERGTAQNRIHEYGSENYINIRISWGEAIKFWLAGVVAMFIVWLVFLTLFGSLIRTAMW